MNNNNFLQSLIALLAPVLGAFSHLLLPIIINNLLKQVLSS